jgi:hypothetical protein
VLDKDEQKEENRRAILQLYQTFLTQNLAILLACSVAGLGEVQAFLSLHGFLSRVLISVLFVVTFGIGVDRFAMASYWNRRIGYVGKVNMPDVEKCKDSLVHLDYYYAERQWEREHDVSCYWWTNYRMPKPEHYCESATWNPRAPSDES